jgi:hypothetical protein
MMLDGTQTETVMIWSLMRDSYPIDSAHDAAALRFSLGFCLG